MHAHDTTQSPEVSTAHYVKTSFKVYLGLVDEDYGAAVLPPLATVQTAEEAADVVEQVIREGANSLSIIRHVESAV